MPPRDHWTREIDTLRAGIAVLDARLVAAERRAQVVDTIAEAPDPDAAVQALQENFALSEEQARYIFDLPLSQLTAGEVARASRERDFMQAKLASLGG